METPFWQLNSFWAGIAATAILAIPLGILANACYYKLVSYLDSRKITSQQKSRKRAFELDAIINDLRLGRRDRYIYMLRMVMGQIAAFLICVVNLAAAGVVLALVPSRNSFEPVLLHPLLVLIALLAFAMFGVLMLQLTARRFRTITNALEKYEDYKENLIKQWGAPPSENNSE